MAKRKSFSLNKNLQQGLSQTMSAVKNYAGALRFEVIPLSDIELDPDNPRDLALSFNDLPDGPSQNDADYQRKMDEIEGIKSLSQTIKSQGLINPVVVYKKGDKYRLVAGERRCLASMLINKSEIKANILDEKPTELRRSLLQWIENSERQDLSLWERIGNVKQVLQHYQAENLANGRATATTLRDLLGCSLPHAMNYHAVLNSDDIVLSAIQQDKLKNLEKAALIAKFDSPHVRKKALEACMSGASLKDLKTYANQDKLAKKQIVRQKPKESRGRKAASVNLGKTTNLKAVKHLVDLVLGEESYRHYKSQFANTDWQDFAAASQAFKQIMTILEASE